MSERYNPGHIPNAPFLSIHCLDIERRGLMLEMNNRVPTATNMKPANPMIALIEDAVHQTLF